MSHCLEAHEGVPANSPQGTLHAALMRDLDALDRALRDQVATLGHAQRRTVPAAGGWDVDAVCEHLCLSNEHYLRVMTAAVDASLPAVGNAASSHLGSGAPFVEASRGRWRPTLGGRLLVHALVSPRRMPRPAVLTPGPEPRAAVLEALLATHQALRALLQRAASMEWRRVRFSSPFARLVRLNLGDGALVIVRHGERHARQIVRIRDSILS